MPVDLVKNLSSSCIVRRYVGNALVPFYPNHDDVTFGLCYRKSVCLSSVLCLSSVTLVHPTQAVEFFGNISSPLYTLTIV